MKLDGQMAGIRGENEAMESRIDASLSRLEAGVNASFARMREDMARMREDIARRDKSNIQWLVGMIFAASVLIIAVIGLLIRFPTAPMS